MIDCLQIIPIIPFQLNHYGLKFRNIKSRMNYFKCVSVVILICFYLRLLSTGTLTKEMNIFNFSMSRMTCIRFTVYREDELIFKSYVAYRMSTRSVSLQVGLIIILFNSYDLMNTDIFSFLLYDSLYLLRRPLKSPQSL